MKDYTVLFQSKTLIRSPDSNGSIVKIGKDDIKYTLKDEKLFTILSTPQSTAHLKDVNDSPKSTGILNKLKDVNDSPKNTWILNRKERIDDIIQNEAEYLKSYIDSLDKKINDIVNINKIEKNKLLEILQKCKEDANFMEKIPSELLVKEKKQSDFNEIFELKSKNQIKEKKIEEFSSIWKNNEDQLEFDLKHLKIKNIIQFEKDDEDNWKRDRINRIQQEIINSTDNIIEIQNYEIIQSEGTHIDIFF